MSHSAFLFGVAIVALQEIAYREHVGMDICQRDKDIQNLISIDRQQPIPSPATQHPSIVARPDYEVKMARKGGAGRSTRSPPLNHLFASR